MKTLYAVLGGTAVVAALATAGYFGFQHACALNGTLCEWRGRYHDAREPYITHAQFSFMSKPGAIVYPWAAMAREIEGSVDIKLTVASDGTIDQAEVIRSSGFDLLDEAALEASKTFEAAAQMSPLGSTEHIRITFVMPEEAPTKTPKE